MSTMQLIAKEKILLLDLLRTGYPDSSKTYLRGLVQAGRVDIEGKVAARSDIWVEPGQSVQIGKRPKVVHETVKILHEDRDLVVIDKPEGLLSVATDFDLERSAHSLLKRRFHRPRIYPVHRLDRETSGLLVFAYNERARQGLKEQFEEHTIEREYRALVHGKLTEKKGTFRSYLREDAHYFVHSEEKSSKEGKLAITHYELIEYREEMTLVRLKLETGRKNQIRVHLSEAGFPIVGDTKYGKPEDESPRLYLHALKLGFVHPVTKKTLLFYSPSAF